MDLGLLVYATKTSGTVNDTVNSLVNKLFELIIQYPGQRKPFFEEKMKASQRSIQRWLNQLQHEDKIEFRGAPKTGDIGKSISSYYILIVHRAYSSLQITFFISHHTLKTIGLKVFLVDMSIELNNMITRVIAFNTE